jgi:hypothetical protein
MIYDYIPANDLYEVNAYGSSEFKKLSLKSKTSSCSDIRLTKPLGGGRL